MSIFGSTHQLAQSLIRVRPKLTEEPQFRHEIEAPRVGRSGVKMAPFDVRDSSIEVPAALGGQEGVVLDQISVATGRVVKSVVKTGPLLTSFLDD